MLDEEVDEGDELHIANIIAYYLEIIVLLWGQVVLEVRLTILLLVENEKIAVLIIM